MPRYLLRVAVPDRPGRLGALTTALGQLEVNIVGFDLIEVADGIAVDELLLDTGVETLHRLPGAIEAIPGAAIEVLRPAAPDIESLSSLELALELVSSVPDQRRQALTTMLPAVLSASWCAVVTDSGSGASMAAASPGAPPLTALEAPWLPLRGPRRLAPGAWTRGLDRDDGYEFAAAPIGRAGGALLVAREHGPKFRGHELEDLDLLARIFDRLQASPHR